MYRGTIRYADTLVERIIESLKSEGLYKNTVVVVFGDHGDDIGENGMFSHAFSMTDAVLRVPLIVVDPTGRPRPTPSRGRSN